MSGTYQAGDGKGRPVGSAHEEPPQDNLVEGSIGATGQEPVQLLNNRIVRKMAFSGVGFRLFW